MDYAYFPGAPPPPSFAGHYMSMAQFPPTLPNEESNGSSPVRIRHQDILILILSTSLLPHPARAAKPCPLPSWLSGIIHNCRIQHVFHHAQTDGIGKYQDHMDQPNFLPYDTSFSSFEPSSMLAPTSGSPQQTQMSMAHVGSVDSGVGLEVDMEGSQQVISSATGHPLSNTFSPNLNGIRGSSEEKEMNNLTPAQSRRKAQNRAA